MLTHAHETRPLWSEQRPTAHSTRTRTALQGLAYVKMRKLALNRIDWIGSVWLPARPANDASIPTFLAGVRDYPWMIITFRSCPCNKYCALRLILGWPLLTSPGRRDEAPHIPPLKPAATDVRYIYWGHDDESLENTCTFGAIPGWQKKVQYSVSVNKEVVWTVLLLADYSCYPWTLIPKPFPDGASKFECMGPYVCISKPSLMYGVVQNDKEYSEKHILRLEDMKHKL